MPANTAVSRAPAVMNGTNGNPCFRSMELSSGSPGSSSRRRWLAWAFDRGRLNRIEIRCASGNHRSRAIPVRLGLREEGLLRDAEWLYDHFVDHVVYAALAKEWQVEGGRAGAGRGL